MQFSLREDLTPDLRQLLDEHWEILEATIQPYAAIVLHPQPTLSLWQSKVGSVPYLPKNIEYPKGADGQELQLLAQINFAEVPSLPNFPQAGILQFYIAPENELYGADLENLSATDNFRVLYFSEIETDEAQLTTDFSFLPEFESPLLGSAALQFEKKFSPISGGDYRFHDSLGKLLSEFHDDLIWEYADKVNDGVGHRIGGYPGFTQADPREWKEAYLDHDCLLFQLDSEQVQNANCFVDLMWGDTGIANFFIKSEALKKLDFSNVLFNWDCC
ncbi:YwqG family protein [Phormidesmis priestleyi]